MCALLQADRQEALVRAEQRRMAIERANKVLFDATDDVKALHSKLLLSEVGGLHACSTLNKLWTTNTQHSRSNFSSSGSKTSYSMQLVTALMLSSRIDSKTMGSDIASQHTSCSHTKVQLWCSLWVALNTGGHCHLCDQVLGENQALVDFKRQVVVLKKNQDAEFVARQKEALAVRVYS